MSAGGSFKDLEEALQDKYDEFFRDLPQVGFQTCMDYQDTNNEIPYYQTLDENALGRKYRRPTDNYVTKTTNGTLVPRNQKRQGTLAQRHIKLSDIVAESRKLTTAEIGSVIVCDDPTTCLKGGSA